MLLYVYYPSLYEMAARKLTSQCSLLPSATNPSLYDYTQTFVLIIEGYPHLAGL